MINQQQKLFFKTLNQIGLKTQEPKLKDISLDGLAYLREKVFYINSRQC